MPYPITGFNPSTLIDWDGKLACVIYLSGCNFCCPFCHSAELIPSRPEQTPAVPFSLVRDFLREKEEWIDAVVVGGGEPTGYPGLPELLSTLKQYKLAVKLDTNGSNPDVIRRVLTDASVDYVAMDIKAPLNPDAYCRLAGRQVNIAAIRESIGLLRNSGIEYEFRTTVVPGLLRRQDIGAIAQDIRGARRYVLQQFDPHHTLSPELRAVPPYPVECLREWAGECRDYVEQVRVRAAG